MRGVEVWVRDEGKAAGGDAGAKYLVRRGRWGGGEGRVASWEVGGAGVSEEGAGWGAGTRWSVGVL